MITKSMSVPNLRHHASVISVIIRHFATNLAHLPRSAHATDATHPVGPIRPDRAIRAILECRRQFTFKQLYNIENADNTPNMTKHVVYSSLQSVLEVFNSEKFKDDPNVIQLLKIYSDAKESAKNTPQIAKNESKHPLIVFEGLDLSGKSTLTRLTSEKVNGACLRTPPSSIPKELRAAFDEHLDLKAAFYTLGNYIAAFEVARELQTKPVILDRFWYSTVANSLARTVDLHPREFHLPPKGNVVYRWPEDLLRPDIVLFLAVSEHERRKRQERRKEITKEEMMLVENHSFRQNVLLAYQCMEGPEIKFVNSDVSVGATLEHVLKAIEHLVPANT